MPDRNLAHLALRVRDEVQLWKRPDLVQLIDGFGDQAETYYPEATSIRRVLNACFSDPDLIESGYHKCYVEMTLSADAESGEYNLPSTLHSVQAIFITHPTTEQRYNLEKTTLVRLHKDRGARFRSLNKGRPTQYYTDIGNGIGFVVRPNLAYIASILGDTIPEDMVDGDDLPAPIYDDDDNVIGSRLPQTGQEGLVQMACERIARAAGLSDQAIYHKAEAKRHIDQVREVMQSREASGHEPVHIVTRRAALRW